MSTSKIYTADLKKDLLFLVADKNMSAAVSGLLERDQIHLSIGCAAFDFDSRTDLKIGRGQNDPGLFTRANEILKPFQNEYRHVVVIIDEEWDGSPGAADIEKALASHIESAGWAPENGLGLAVCPEADVWLWSDSPHSARALGWNSWDELRPALEDKGWLEPGEPKPNRPKEAAEWALENSPKRRPRSSVIYKEVSSKVSLSRCEDSALKRLLAALREWFPLEGLS